ncbi:MAG: hypothetical protein HLUCCA04_01295 [Oceanicaulis sp. HLUCCA04]|nr:MAG: hypothetical protein HLUCCA04_01295 [Oceanicaulis sp. HLUCCA04]
MSDAAPPPSPTPSPSSERGELAEEVFGFNLRSVRSLIDLLIAPRKVFASIIARDRAYTPMVRLWLALLGVQIAISVIWGGYGAIAAQSLQNADPEVIAQLESATGRTREQFFSLYGSIMSVLHGPLVGGFTALSVLVLARFGEKRSFGTNLNLVFAILTAGSIFGLALMPVALAGTQTALMSFIVTAILTLIYALTFIRGATPSLAAGMAGRIVKGVVLSITILLLVLIGGFLANILSLVIASAWPA